MRYELTKAALTGLCNLNARGSFKVQTIGRWAVKIADAVLAELERKP